VRSTTSAVSSLSGSVVEDWRLRRGRRRGFVKWGQEIVARLLQNISTTNPLLLLSYSFSLIYYITKLVQNGCFGEIHVAFKIAAVRLFSNGHRTTRHLA
jgi:uncharacterized heparinase superfamily protein